VALFLALPACYFPLPLSIPGGLVDLEMFLLISPVHFGNAVVTVTAHSALDICIEHKFGFVFDAEKNGPYRIVTGTSRAKAIAVNLSEGVTPFARLQNRAC
jgi:hypothetical protein